MNQTIREIPSQIRGIIGRHPPGRQSLIPVLQDVQESFGYLVEEAVGELARQSGISENEIYGVATFYTQFRFRPPGEHLVHVCLGTACHVRGGPQVLEAFEQRLGIKAGQTSADGKFELARVACVGCCALAPVVVVDGEVQARMTPQRAAALIRRRENKKESGES